MHILYLSIQSQEGMHTVVTLAVLSNVHHDFNVDLFCTFFTRRT